MTLGKLINLQIFLIGLGLFFQLIAGAKSETSATLVSQPAYGTPPGLHHLVALDFAWATELNNLLDINTQVEVLDDHEQEKNYYARVKAHYETFPGYSSDNPVTRSSLFCAEFKVRTFYDFLFPSLSMYISHTTDAAMLMYELFSPNYVSSSRAPKKLTIYQILNIAMLFVGFENGQNIDRLSQPAGPYKIFIENFTLLISNSLKNTGQHKYFANLLLVLQTDGQANVEPTSKKHIPSNSQIKATRSKLFKDLAIHTLISNSKCRSAFQKSRLLSYLHPFNIDLYLAGITYNYIPPANKKPHGIININRRPPRHSNEKPTPDNFNCPTYGISNPNPLSFESAINILRYYHGQETRPTLLFISSEPIITQTFTSTLYNHIFRASWELTGAGFLGHSYN
ncbi:hypothetical protein NEHOM01_2086 [Nematocida homosporus]|uniref:uncharacterized protein n=1 Tax=Nematocida homosporus TaxID=1912981 RepID=UPI00221F105F|nr:uncharacterized protein NEHOM01_2086 [Nematocida homosporus]KAI5187313.1 hypothetical protein NEHOM01_2086 [Nematocida homosporus]